MDQILFQGPGYTIAKTDQAETMTHYLGMSSEEQAETGWMRGPYVDLIANPCAIDSIPELAKSPNLKALIAAAIGPEAQLFTIGCDVGEFPGVGDKGPGAHVGAYVSYAFRDYEKASNLQRNIDLAIWMLSGMKDAPPDGLSVNFEFIIEPLKSFYGKLGAFSVMAKPIGYGDNFEKAWLSFDWAASKLAESVARQRDPSVALEWKTITNHT